MTGTKIKSPTLTHLTYFFGITDQVGTYVSPESNNYRTH